MAEIEVIISESYPPPKENQSKTRNFTKSPKYVYLFFAVKLMTTSLENLRSWQTEEASFGLWGQYFGSQYEKECHEPDISGGGTDSCCLPSNCISWLWCEGNIIPPWSFQDSHTIDIIQVSIISCVIFFACLGGQVLIFLKKTLYEFLAAWNNPSHHRNHWDIQHPYIYIHDINIYMYNIHPSISRYIQISQYISTSIFVHIYIYIYNRSIIIIPILLYPRPGKTHGNLPNNPSCLTIWVSSWVKPWLPCGSCAWCVWYGSWSQGAPAVAEGWVGVMDVFCIFISIFFHLSRQFIATFSPRLVNPKG